MAALWTFLTSSYASEPRIVVFSRVQVAAWIASDEASDRYDRWIERGIVSPSSRDRAERWSDALLTPLRQTLGGRTLSPQNAGSTAHTSSMICRIAWAALALLTTLPGILVYACSKTRKQRENALYHATIESHNWENATRFLLRTHSHELLVTLNRSVDSKTSFTPKQGKRLWKVMERARRMTSYEKSEVHSSTLCHALKATAPSNCTYAPCSGEETQDTLASLQTTNKPYLFCALGSLYPAKDIQQLQERVPNLKKKFLDDDLFQLYKIFEIPNAFWQAREYHHKNNLMKHLTGIQKSIAWAFSCENWTVGRIYATLVNLTLDQWKELTQGIIQGTPYEELSDNLRKGMEEHVPIRIYKEWEWKWLDSARKIWD